MTDEPTGKVLYNGNCPVCRTGADMYRGIGGGEACGWVDVRQIPDALAQHGVTLKDVMYRVHFVEENGKVLRGAPAVAAVLAQDRRFRWLAKLMRLPVLNWIAALSYEVIAAPLYLWNRWGERRRAG